MVLDKATPIIRTENVNAVTSQARTPPQFIGHIYTVNIQEIDMQTIDEVQVNDLNF